MGSVVLDPGILQHLLAPGRYPQQLLVCHCFLGTEDSLVELVGRRLQEVPGCSHLARESKLFSQNVSSSWDKLTPVTEEGTKLVCSSLFFLAFYKNRHKNRNGNEKAVHLRVERPCVTRRVSACLRPKTKRGEKLLL